ncbi:hypothetical protein CLAFUW4_10347 [Fulvia fulva]|uniref:Uncharacterized protein n=1 Tax=Passalora fulva TaxID=5499 RepID=A0A9Q8P775_PASFU|nr:uncharacterized protein CLAFUR5_04962 [Fulvia fulva]KAK4616276.1 hypothetical protein CLAFUR4_10351 [Fulvia fulva]KAK4617083.1 hypothetical protein CLAFUR0_10351 [Fulvia fulva]UJO15763.1 hypothetical protein CLAFUR5_04962 [Fulvia fulva]WPV19317.1 hypothetical protein CLAFUW4_10347 [Fulvia fulva]WPV33947.1 hypothetical protein CLAFUW7_10347 [Fulvia fulva]
MSVDAKSHIPLLLTISQELEHFYRCYAEAFEEIHDFFRGSSTSPRAVAYEIRRIATWIDENAHRGYRDIAWVELARDLWRLANEVAMGYTRDARYYSRHAGGGPWYRADRGLGWR